MYAPPVPNPHPPNASERELPSLGKPNIPECFDVGSSTTVEPSRIATSRGMIPSPRAPPSPTSGR